MNLEQYIKHLQTLDKSCQWPIEKYNKKFSERMEIHKKFPHVVTYPGLTCHGGILEEMQDWCRENYGDKDGKCYWGKCELGFKVWYKKFEDELEEELDRCKSKRKADKIIDKHYEMIENRFDKPKDHTHTGIWTAFFVIKTGYDYGYEDFCFKNVENAFHFKLMWDEEVERRK